MDRQGRPTIEELLRVRWDGLVTSAGVSAPAWFGLQVEHGEVRFDPTAGVDPGWRALGVRLVARAAAGRPGPVGVVAGAAGCDVLDLVVDATGWVLLRRAAGPEPGHLELLGRLRAGAVGLLRHEFRSPWVRLQGAVTLTARTARRPGAGAAVLDELEEIEAALMAQLELADAAATAIAGLLARERDEAVDGPGFLAAVAGARQRTDVAQDGGWAPVTDAAGRRGRQLTVVVPRPRATGAPAVARLLDHVAACWPSQAGRLVVPGGSSSWPPTTSTREATGVSPGPDPEFDLRLARRWTPAGSALHVLQDVGALEAMGVVVAVADTGPWLSLQLHPDGVAEVTGPLTDPVSLTPLLRSVTPVGVAGGDA